MMSPYKIKNTKMDIFLDRVGCKRNATTNSGKTAKLARETVSAHVAVPRQRLRTGIHDIVFELKTTHKNYLTFLTLIMTLSLIVQYQQASAASLKAKNIFNHTEQSTEGRHISKVEQTLLHEICNDEAKWAKACGGEYIGNGDDTSESNSIKRVKRKEALKILKFVLTENYRELRTKTPEIDISDANKTWSFHNNRYRFLPQIRKNSKLVLRRWHRKAQIYAGTFIYLRRARLLFDYQHSGTESKLSRALKKYEQAALLILCQLEATRNASLNGRPQKLHFYKPKKMRRIFKYRTQIPNFDSKTCSQNLRDVPEAPDVNRIDLIYAKKKFLEFLRSMRMIVKRKIQSTNNSSINSSNSMSRSLSHFDNSDSYSITESGSLGSRHEDSVLDSLSQSEFIEHRGDAIQIIGKQRHRGRHGKHKKSV